MRALVLIGDIVQSRHSPDRKALQRQFGELLQQMNADHPALVSPYTVTLGDEFQAVLNDAQPALDDVVQILAALHPNRLRFSFAVGEITTDINPRQAIGMDGPAFHDARDGITALKKRRQMFGISGLPADTAELIDCSLRIAELGMQKWKKNRFDIMHALGEGASAQEIGQRLGISDKAVYKNIKDGGIEDIRALFHHIAVQANRAMEAN